MSSRDVAGRPVCQVVGCQEPAKPWGYVFTFASVMDIRVIVCERHRAEMEEAMAG